jgi:transposase InsO family protein
LRFVFSQRNKSRVCRILELNRSSIYYKSKKKPDVLEALVKKIFKKHNANYGCLRIREEIKKLGFVISKRRIGKILKNNGLEAKYGRRRLVKNVYTATKEKYIVENLIRNVRPSATNDIWQTDYTEFKASDGKLYLNGIIDIYDKTIVGICYSQNADKAMVKQSVECAVEKYGIPRIMHSDRGSVYTSNEYRDLLKHNTILQSMSKPHTPNENQYIETFWKTMKTEIGRTKNFTIEQLKLIINYYIYYYNTERIHSAIEYKTPLEKRIISMPA